MVAAAIVVALSATAGLGAATSPTASAADATITRGPLTSQLHATGTLQYLAQLDGTPYTVVDHTDGALTALPAIGQVIDQGEVLFRAADQPVVLLNGTTPAYRSLSPGDTGPDVRQLNADLVALHYASSSELNPSSDYFSTSTATALEKLQARLGVTETGTVRLGQAVFLPAPIRITGVNATLGTAYRPDSSGASPAGARLEFVEFSPGGTQSVDPAAGDPRKCKPHKQHRCTHPRRGKHHKHKHHKPGESPKPGRHGGQKPRRSAGGNPGAKAPGGAGKPGSGPGSPNPSAGGPRGPSGGAPNPPPARPILQATSTRRVVVVQLDARAARSVKVGRHASITLPSGRTISGEIARIGTTANASGGVPVYINLAHPGFANNLDQAPVQVQITTAAVVSALRVPITALVARSATQYAIRAIGARGVTRLVPVRPGRFDDADGLVQVTGTGLAPGQRVAVPSG
jgi:hypothetical protein